MTDAREKIADIIDVNVYDSIYGGTYGHYDAADAILAAMPDIVRGMVKPMVWYSTKTGQASQSRIHWYEVYENSKGTYTLDDGESVQEHPTFALAQQEANTHNAAQILKGLGL